ncbi:MAG TPA: hypothetical protein VLM79_16255 [Kofleriaceae bacterium]|nr:hypothetical protein [Kofleriaceae bacterium]
MQTMQNRKLTYEVLDSLIDQSCIHLEVTNVDVKRLRDDRSEIIGGQDIAFVATATFRATSSTTAMLKQQIKNGDIAVGDALFAIGPDAEVRSETLEIDEDSVALWLNDHYAFRFTLNGVDDSDGGPFQDLGSVVIATTSHEPHEPTLVLPWLRKLNTGAFKDGFIDVDVRITENTVDPPEVATTWQLDTNLAIAFRRKVVASDDRVLSDEPVQFDIALEVDDPDVSLDQIAAGGLRVPLDGGGTGVRLVFMPKVANPSAKVQKKSLDAARATATTPPSKHKP